MPVRAAGLSAVKVRTAPPGRFGDGDGLYLLVRTPDAAFWLFRYTRTGRMREMGLGRARGANSVTLAEARQRAGDLYRQVRAGRDPLADREAAAEAAEAATYQAAVASRTFRQAADDFIRANEHGWRNSKHAAQWGATLATYAYPHMAEVPVRDVSTAHVLAALEPIWKSKPETASRVRGRVESVLSAEAVRGNRTADNPARWRGHLDQILPARSKVAPVEHHAALPYPDLPAFMLRLSAADGMGARALGFAILCAARTGEVLGARWGEIDLQAALWTIRPARMKAGREHRVPLAPAAVALLRKVGTLRTGTAADDFVFPSGEGARALSNMALTMALRRMKRGDITAHGFRSTFRDWAAEQTSVPGEVAEAALAHVVGDKTEAAYRRGDLFEKRRQLMAAWADFALNG